jgi:hypothetical protein
MRRFRVEVKIRGPQNTGKTQWVKPVPPRGQCTRPFFLTYLPMHVCSVKGPLGHLGCRTFPKGYGSNRGIPYNLGLLDFHVCDLAKVAAQIQQLLLSNLLGQTPYFYRIAGFRTVSCRHWGRRPVVSWPFLMGRNAILPQLLPEQLVESTTQYQSDTQGIESGEVFIPDLDSRVEFMGS